LFRRRHVSSRIATFAEALSSITWAGAGALVVISLWPAVVAGLVALAILAGAWMLSPKRQ
jgi:ABC-2 type transport system permease protein